MSSQSRKAIEANALLMKLIGEGNHEKLAAYDDLGEAARLAVPQAGETIVHFNDRLLAGSISMASFVCG